MTSAKRLTFRTTIKSAGKTATGIVIPNDIVDALNHGKRPPVKVTMNNKTYRSTVAVMGGEYMVGVSAQNRELTGVAAGDEVDVHLELDTETREIIVPADLAKALKREPDAKQFFDALSNSMKNWHVAALEGAKTSETRTRRLDKSMDMLRAHRTR